MMQQERRAQPRAPNLVLVRNVIVRGGRQDIASHSALGYPGRLGLANRQSECAVSQLAPSLPGTRACVDPLRTQLDIFITILQPIVLVEAPHDIVVAFCVRDRIRPFSRAAKFRARSVANRTEAPKLAALRAFLVELAPADGRQAGGGCASMAIVTVTARHDLLYFYPRTEGLCKLQAFNNLPHAVR